MTPHDPSTPAGSPRSYGRLTRPYQVTGGRTDVGGEPLAVEAMVEMSWRGWAALTSLQFEQAEIIGLTRRSVSVAEVASGLELPLGVARVLVADMEGAGHVTVHRPAAGAEGHEPKMLDSILDGLRAL